MKRSAMLVIAMLLVLAVVGAGLYMRGSGSGVGAAGTANFSGKWICYKMAASDGEQKMEINLEEMAGLSGTTFSEEEAGYVEFKDGKAYVVMDAGDDVEELTYKAEGNKLIWEITDEMKEAGMSSGEIYFEGDDLVVVLSGKDGSTMKNYFRKPK